MGSAARSTSVSIAFAALLFARVGRSQTAPAPAPPSSPAPATGPSPAPATATAAAGTAETTEPTVDVIAGEHPPPTNIVYFQYGVAFAAELPSSPGPMCNSPAPCILGPGGGITVRAGWRGAGPIYLGAAYEVTKQDPSKLYRLATLQQARAEGRYYFMTARVTEPYASVGLGASAYGNTWGIDTWGPAGSIGFGLEYQVTQRTVVGIDASYRVLYFSRFTDTSGAQRDPGVAQLVGLSIVLEQRDPSSTEQKRSSSGP